MVSLFYIGLKPVSNLHLFRRNDDDNNNDNKVTTKERDIVFGKLITAILTINSVGSVSNL